MESISESWDLEIKPQDSVFNLHLKDVWNYRDLLWLLVRRDFVSFYKQTIFGPLWFFIQPIFTTFIFTIIFSNMAHIKTDGPAPLFYMAGNIAWNYFADGLNKTSTVFRDNANIFGKVYFPRLIMPLSIIVSNLVKFAIQFLLFLCYIAYYVIFEKYTLAINWYVLLFPVIMLMMAILGLGLGLIITALTTKYRDLVFLVSFGIQLFMYATPIIYPLSTALSKYHGIIAFNPLSGLIETFKYGFLGTGQFYPWIFVYSIVSSILIFLLGLVVFNRVEKNFVDTI